MRKTIIINALVLVGFFTIFSIKTVSANGIGFYIPISEGTAAWTNDDISYDIDVDTKYSGFGLIIDSNVSKRKVYNYRLCLGIENVEVSTTSGSIDLKGYALHSDFGFGGNVADVVRFWGGFELRSAFYLEAEIGNSDLDSSITGFGIGPLFALNVNAVPVVSFTMKSGYIFGAYSGDIDGLDVDMKDDRHFFINFGIVFRFAEDFHY